MSVLIHLPILQPPIYLFTFLSLFNLCIYQYIDVLIYRFFFLFLFLFPFLSLSLLSIYPSIHQSMLGDFNSQNGFLKVEKKSRVAMPFGLPMVYDISTDSIQHPTSLTLTSFSVFFSMMLFCFVVVVFSVIFAVFSTPITVINKTMLRIDQ